MIDITRCGFRYPWSLMDWNRAALATGDYDVVRQPENPLASQCILDFHHSPAPHMVVNPWTRAIHAAPEGKNDRH